VFKESFLGEGYVLIEILKNAIKCNHCGDIIESTHRHNFVTCSCGCCSVDGGLDYLRRCFKNSQEEDFIDLSRTIEIDE
jgi:hypothetical protein